MKLNKKTLFALSLAAVSFVACDDDDDNLIGGAQPIEVDDVADDNEEEEEVTFVIPDDTAAAIAQTYSDIARTNYADALDGAQALKIAVDAFVDTPSQEGFDAAKQAWLDAREIYGTSEAFRLADGPIDRIDEVTEEEGPEGLLNSWPMDEGFVDYILNEADGTIINGGIVNDDSSIDAMTLANANGAVEETEVTVGWHAIEFLLWGQDNTDPLDNQKGLREWSDYDTTNTTVTNADRRGEYLKVTVNLLIENLQTVIDQWEEDTNYDVTFTELSNEEMLTNVLSGIGKFANGELRGERIIPGWDAGGQEDEHSCFSDNTHVDIAKNYEGIRNIYFGEYNGASLNGTSVSDLVELADSAVAQSVIEAFNAADTAIANATDPEGEAVPFDRAIVPVTLGGEQARLAIIEQSIDALSGLGVQLSAAANAIGISISVELEE